jgi:pSer/pThr/pTyr-binding forkhead associated (FHA) protein
VEVQKAQKIVPVPTLHFSEGALAGRVVRLDRDIATIGRREDNAYVLPDPRVSRVHAEIRKEAAAVIITDLGSSAGTKVNGEDIKGPTVIRHGDKISFGPVTAAFEDPAAASQFEEATVVFEVPKVETGPHLSPRQQQVLELMAEGLTNAEIGDRLGVTERTVKAYAQELYDKLGVRNRAGAVAEAAKLGLL